MTAHDTLLATLSARIGSKAPWSREQQLALLELIDEHQMSLSALGKLTGVSPNRVASMRDTARWRLETGRLMMFEVVRITDTDTGWLEQQSLPATNERKR